MKLFLFIPIFILSLLVGCAKAPTPGASVVAPTRQPSLVSNGSGMVTSTASATALPSRLTAIPLAATSTPKIIQTESPSGLTQTSGALTVQIFSDADVQVDLPQYLISGRAPTGTVVSINDHISIIDKSQQFAVSVSLDEGPNLVEIVASDESGNEVSFLLIVTYNSQP